MSSFPLLFDLGSTRPTTRDIARTVKAGTVVTWLNKDEEPHTIFSDAGLFRSGAVDTDGTFEFKFEKPGTYHYLCTIHPRMVGTIVVE